MLPRERVIAALEHREGDRIPWGEHSIDYNVFEDILGRPTLTQAKMRTTQAFWDGRRDEVVESMKRDVSDLIDALEMDIVYTSRVLERGFRPEPMEKLDEQTYRDSGGNLFRVSATTHDLMPYKLATAGYVEPTMADLERQLDDVVKAPPLDPTGSEWEFVRHMVATKKKTHFVMLLVGDIVFPGIGATEEDRWMSILEKPELCRKQQELTTAWLLRELPVYTALGVDAIMPCGDLGSSTGLMASPAVYREMVYPFHQRHVAAARACGLKVLKHCCGHIWPVIQEIADLYDAYEGIQGTAGMDVAKLKQAVGDRLCLWGGIWHEHIILGGVDDIRADARHAFAGAAPGGGYIMGSSHSLAVDAKRENILEMKRLRDTWGVYPIRPNRFI
ncbi:MAG: hypothetical protein NTV86_16055 [Planctomycetota bacterium]|nr:hypothetical protein [Planctomycetota bacterium]